MKFFHIALFFWVVFAFHMIPLQRPNESRENLDLDPKHLKKLSLFFLLYRKAKSKIRLILGLGRLGKGVGGAVRF
jgi:hypothetical protein